MAYELVEKKKKIEVSYLNVHVCNLKWCTMEWLIVCGVINQDS